MSGDDYADLLIATQQNAIEEVKKLLKINDLPIVDDGKIMNMLNNTIDDTGDYNPYKAFELLASEPLELKKRSNRKIPNRLNPLTRKLSQSNNDTSAASTTRKNRIAEARQYVIQQEKQDLELKLPKYLNGANVDIIARDNHCFFRSITHQLRDYGFYVPNDYQAVRNLIADYIDKNIQLDIVNGIEYDTVATVKDYTDAIRGNLWGGALEIQAVHDGCLDRLTGGQTLKIIIYFVNNKNEIALEPDFFNTIPKDEDWRLPIRLLYVGNTVDYNGNNHFHRIYFIDPYRQKKHYVEENVRPEIAQSPSASSPFRSPYDDLSEEELQQQITAYKQLQETIRPEIAQSPSRQLTGHNSMLSPRIEMSPSELEAQIKAYEQFNKGRINKGRKIVEINENSGEYLNLLNYNLKKPFMVMGYQNGAPNILYKTNYIPGYSGDGITRFAAVIYVPKDLDKNNRKYTRYPSPTMLDVDGKTIVNISLHKWANIWDDVNNIPLGDNTHADSAEKKLNINMVVANGVEEVIGTKDAEFTSISKKTKDIPYIRHGERGMSFSPDTGVIAIDDNCEDIYCSLYITDPTDRRELILHLRFLRNEPIERNNSKGGKSRRRRNTRKLRRNKRRQTKRRQ